MLLKRLSSSMKVPVLVLSLWAMFSTSAYGLTVTWDLFDHPDGSENPPPYGLRLDEVVHTNNAGDVCTGGGNGCRWDDYSFSFDHPHSAATATYGSSDPEYNNQETFHIEGIIRGGRFGHDGETRTDWDLSAEWLLDLYYVDNIDRYGGADLGTTRGGPNGGVLGSTDAPTTIYIDQDTRNPLDGKEDAHLGGYESPFANVLGTIQSIDGTTDPFNFVDSTFSHSGDGFILTARASSAGHYLYYDVSQGHLNCADTGGNNNADNRPDSVQDTLCDRHVGEGWLNITWGQLGGQNDPHKYSGTRDLLFTGVAQ